jgi:MFS family permease
MPHKNIRLLTWFNFFTDFRLYNAIAIIYFAKVTGSYALGMTVFSITMISAALLEVPTGIFSDKIGRKYTIVCGAAASVVYAIFYALASTVKIEEMNIAFFVLAIGAVFEGLSRSFYSGNNDAFLYDTLAEQELHHDFSEHLGKTSSMFQLALAISGVIGAFIASWSFEIIMWLSVMPQVACLLIAFQMVEPKVHKQQESNNIYEHLGEAIQLFIKNPTLRLLGIASTWRYAFGEASYQFSSAFMNSLWPVWTVGLARMSSNLFATLSFRIAGKVIKKYTAVPVLIFGSIFNRVLGIAAVVMNNIFSPALLAITSLTFGTGTVAESDIFQKEISDHHRATMGSLASFAGNILFGIVSICVGLVADKFDPRVAYFMMQILMLPSVWWQWRLVGR